MTILSGAEIVEYGAQATVIADPAVIADGGFSAGTVTALTPTDKVECADAVLVVTMSVAAGAAKRFHLYRRDLNINGAGQHARIPSANLRGLYVGSFNLDIVTTEQNIPLPMIPISNDQEFYVENDTGQSTVGTTTLKVTPRTRNTKA